MNYCHICYSKFVEDYAICDRCDQYYCEDCSYTFSPHYQFEGSRCYYCAEQYRRTPLSIELIRNNKIRGYIDE